MTEVARVGAVDLGSNSFHLVVAQESQGRIQVVDRIKERVGLGAGIQRRGQLDEEVAERALRCLERFHERLRGVPHRRIRAVGTKAFRDLRKHPDFEDPTRGRWVVSFGDTARRFEMDQRSHTSFFQLLWLLGAHLEDRRDQLALDIERGEPADPPGALGWD